MEGKKASNIQLQKKKLKHTFDFEVQDKKSMKASS